LNISSSADPTIRIRRARIIGIVKLSSLKHRQIIINVGIVIASPPSAGVIPSCNAFSSLSKVFPFLLVPGLYVMSCLSAICPTIGVKIREDIEPMRKMYMY